MVLLMVCGERAPLGYFWWGRAGDAFVTLLKLTERTAAG